MFNALDRLGLRANEDKNTHFASVNNAPGNPNTIYNQPQTVTTAPTQFTSAQVALDSYKPQTIGFNTPTEQQNMEAAATGMNTAIQSVLGEENAYIQNARRTGLENASKRGLLNSSISSGASQRAALDAAMPFISGIYNRGNAQTDFYSAAKLLPLQSALNFSNDFASRAADNPEVYTPSYINGMTNFFMSNMQNVLNNFFGDDALKGGG